MKISELKNIQLDLYTHPFASQIILLRMALLNEEQEKLVGIGAMESDVLGDMNLSGLGLRNSSTYGSQLYDVVNKSNMTGKQFNGLLDLIIIPLVDQQVDWNQMIHENKKIFRTSQWGHLFAECFFNWAVLSDEQMRKRWPFSPLSDEQMSNKVGVEHQPVKYKISASGKVFSLQKPVLGDSGPGCPKAKTPFRRGIPGIRTTTWMSQEVSKWLVSGL